jgi:1-acyl-sn-glycerol-3-phosphate acyltransferase
MRTVLWFIYFWVYLIWILPDMLRANQFEKTGQKAKLEAIVNKNVRNWSRNLLAVAGVKVEVSGLENIPAVPAVFVSNHQGNFDIPILLGSLDQPKSFVAKIELLKMPFIRTWMKHLKCIFIDRKDARQSLAALSNSASVLEDGHSIFIFPEGTRSKGETLGEFKSGALKMAFKTGAPLVPVSIDGSYKIMESQGIWIKPDTVRVTVLPAIETKDMTKEQSRTIGEEIRTLILESRNS